MPESDAPRPPDPSASSKPPDPEGAAEDACDREATSPAAHLARARARIAAGRFQEARQDLDCAADDMGDAAAIERAYLDIRQRGRLREGLKTARQVVERAEEKSGLKARALHVLGHAQSRQRGTRRAILTLLEAAALYDELGDDLGRAHVHDTLGSVYANRGRLEEALHYYSLSLVDKAILGDRRGMAVTTGNLGRLQLRAGRYRDAIAFFERDLHLSTELGDVRGQARMYEDLGRAYVGLEDYEAAEQAFLSCLALAEAQGYRELCFFARVDLSGLRIRQGRLADAATELEAAEALGLAQKASYLALILEAARGELMLARKDPEAVDEILHVLVHLSKAHLPDVEIPLRILVAEGLVERGLTALAETVLLKGLRRAHRDGHARYVPALNEAMTRLHVEEGVLVERGRTRRRRQDDEDDLGEPADGAYVILEFLGEGTYGEVFRAYDPRRGREVALKVIHLERRYDIALRQRLFHSLRVEMEAASRVRHPGVARVYAIGREDDGGVYVVQEYIPGRSLRHLMTTTPTPDAPVVMDYASKLAYALQALHEADLVHRDLKPENVIVRPDGTPVLVDFGIAQVALPEEPLARIAGTLEYMAPEQAVGGVVDGRADLYSLGVICFEWLVGFRPLQLQDRPPEDWVKVLVEAKPPALSELRPDVDPRVDALVAKLLSKRPKARPKSARAVAVRCEKLADSS